MKVKRNARLAAVQVIFQYFFSRADIKKIIKDFDGLNEDSLKRQLNNFDKKLFEKIVFGVSIKEKKIQCLIEENLSENWIYERLDPTSRS